VLDLPACGAGRSAAVSTGLTVTPSMRLAWSYADASSAFQSVIADHCGSAKNASGGS